MLPSRVMRQPVGAATENPVESEWIRHPAGRSSFGAAPVVAGSDAGALRALRVGRGDAVEGDAVGPDADAVVTAPGVAPEDGMRLVPSPDPLSNHVVTEASRSTATSATIPACLRRRGA